MSGEEEAKESGGEVSSRGSSVDRSSPPPLRTPLEESRRHREERGLEELMKALNAFDSAEDKISALCTKYVAVQEENRLMQKTLKETQRLYTAIVGERDKQKVENDKLMLAKVRMESLCRELQKCNRDIKQENLERLQTYEASRQELSDKFQGSLAEIHAAMEAGKERSDKLYAENAALAQKLAALVEQCDSKEQRADKMAAARQLESQLGATKLQAAGVKMQQLAEEKLKSEHALLLKLKERDEQLRESLESEKLLRDQMSLYTAKYDELHASLAQSNGVFDKFKKEMERMNGSLIKVERESRRWKKKFDETSRALVDAAEAKAQTDKRLAQKEAAVARLETLARSIQKERNELQRALNAATATAATAPQADGDDPADSEPVAAAVDVSE